MLVTRTSYRDLEQSACKSYTERLVGTPGVSPLSGYQPWNGQIRLDLPDGTKVESDWLFMAVADDDTAKLGSMQFSRAYLNELIDWKSPNIINAILASSGRYPSKDGFAPEYIEKCAREGRPIYESGLIADTNGAGVKHWLAALEMNPPSNWEFFIQPPPLLVSPTKVEGSIEHEGEWYYPNPEATYSRHQPKGYGYWLSLLGGAERSFVETRILGLWSVHLAGKKVFPEFSIDMVIKNDVDLSAFKGRTLYMGCDSSGLNPSTVLGFYVDACLYVVDEIGVHDMGFHEYVDEHLIPVLSTKYSEFDMIVWCDPSNTASSLEKKTAVAVLLETGLDARLAPTNAFGERIEAVKKLMIRRDGFRIYPQADAPLQGLLGEYIYKEVKGRPGEFATAASKGDASHSMDALQYLALGLQLETGRRKSTPVKFSVRNRRAA
jgi:hypothetical protein